MTIANEKQVAGTHYRSKFQHWDLVAELRLGYFMGQVTKYTVRWRNKKGLEDLQKAAHFADKTEELAAWGQLPKSTCVDWDLMLNTLAKFFATNPLTGEEQQVLYYAARVEHNLSHGHSYGLELTELRNLLQEMIVAEERRVAAAVSPAQPPSSQAGSDT